MTPSRHDSAWRRAAALLASTAAIMALSGASGPAAAAQEGEDGREAFTTLASCLTDAKRLLVLLLVDTSGSLRDTDPAAQRVVGARVAVSGLAALRRSSGVEVEVQVAGFSVGYEPIGPWTSLDEASLGEVNRAVDGFVRRSSGIDTDYLAALSGAHRQLEERSAAVAAGGGSAPCRAVLWFTDGQYDIVDRLSADSRSAGLAKDYAPEVRLDRPGAGAELVSLGRSRLCATGGLVDQMRDAGTSLFFIALTTQIDPGNGDFFDALTTGSGGSTRCGNKGSERSGARLDVSHLGELLAAFDRAASEIGRGVRDQGPATTPICPGGACPAGRRTFALDDTIRRVHLLAVLDAPGVLLEVRGPGGGPLRIDSGTSASAALGDVRVRWNWASPTAVTVDADRPASGRGWDGDWDVTFLDPAGRRDVVARTQVYLFSGLVPKLLRPAALEAGQRAELHVAAVSEVDDEPPTNVPEATLGASVRAPGAQPVTPLRTSAGSDGRFTATYDVPADAQPGEHEVTLRLVVRTRKGLPLAPAERTVRLPVRVSAYPRITLVTDRLHRVTDVGRARATVVVAADPRSGACVWIAGSAVRGPRSAGTFAVDARPSAPGRAECLKVEPGRTRRVEITVDPERAARGTVRGTLRMAAVSDLAAEPRDTVLAYRFSMVRSVDAARRLLVFLALMLLGVLLPVATGNAVRRWRRERAEHQAAGALVFPSFARWAIKRSVGRGWRAARYLGGRMGRLGRTKVGSPLGGLFLGWGRRLGHFGRVRFVGLPDDDAPWSAGGLLRGRRHRPSRHAAAADGSADEWGVALEGDPEPRDRIHISVLLDRSESMLPLVRHVVDGCNAFLAVHRAEPGPARLTLAQFDLQDPLEILLDGVDLAEAPDLTTRQFRPRGVTPLYDSIGALLERTEKEDVERAARGLPQEDQLVVILTDGRDNASSRYTGRSIAERISALEARGWTFVFLGANEDALAEGSTMGIATGSTTGFAATGTGVRKAWASISRATLVHRRKRSQDRIAAQLDFFRGVQDGAAWRRRRARR